MATQCRQIGVDCPFRLGDHELNRTPRLTQSFAGRVREHLVEIEARLYVGVPRAGVLEEFKQRGIDLGTRQSFPSALYRARKSAERASRATRSPIQVTPAEAIGNPEAAAPVSAIEAAKAPVLTPKPRAPVKPLEPGELREIARNRPDLNELARIGREAIKAERSTKT